MICNHDCFNCPYPDCIEDSDLITAAEWKESAGRDHEIAVFNLDNHDRGRYKKDRAWRESHAEEISRKRKEYYLEHRDRELELNRIWYQNHASDIEHLEARRNRLKAYRLENKDKISQQRREKYAQNAESEREKKRAYIAANRDRINARKRELYALKKAKAAELCN